MTYAVLFKIYFLDSFVVRQLERLKARIAQGDLYVIVDETKGPIDPPIGQIPHNRIIRSSEDDMIRRGFVDADPHSAMFWHSADYSLYPLFEDHPPYDYYVSVEYDAVINADLDEIVAGWRRKMSISSVTGSTSRRRAGAGPRASTRSTT